RFCVTRRTCRNDRHWFGRLHRLAHGISLRFVLASLRPGSITESKLCGVSVLISAGRCLADRHARREGRRGVMSACGEAGQDLLTTSLSGYEPKRHSWPLGKSGRCFQATARSASAIDRNSSSASTSTLWPVGIECTDQPASRLSASYVAVNGVAGQPLA